MQQTIHIMVSVYLMMIDNNNLHNKSTLQDTLRQKYSNRFFF